jgi:hypothetical protein
MLLRVLWKVQGDSVHARVCCGHDVQNHDQLTHAGKQAGFENIGRDGSYLSARKPLRAASGQIAEFLGKNSRMSGSRSRTAVQETLPDGRWSDAARLGSPERQISASTLGAALTTAKPCGGTGSDEARVGAVSASAHGESVACTRLAGTYAHTGTEWASQHVVFAYYPATVC